MGKKTVRLDGEDPTIIDFMPCCKNNERDADVDDTLNEDVFVDPDILVDLIEQIIGAKNGCWGVAVENAKVSDIADVTYDFGPSRSMIGDCYAALSPHPAKVVFSDPATIVIDERGGKRVAKCGHGDKYDPRMGIVVAVSKYFGVTYEDIDRYEMVFRMISGMNASDMARIGGIMCMAAEAMTVAEID